MSIHITVVDPANTPRSELLLVIGMLEQFTGPRAAAAPLPPAATAERIDPLDSPDVGVDVQSPQQAFGTPGAAAAFGDAGNVPGVGSPATIDPATVFSPPAAPSAPNVAAAPAIAGGVEVDRSGLPHDPRIHASTKTKKADNTWTARRGVDPAVVAEVTAQLRQLMAAPGNVHSPAHTMTNPSSVVTPAPPAPPAPAPTIAPGVPAITPTAPAGAPTPPAPPVPPAAGVPTIDFPTTAKLVGELVGTGRLTQEKLAEICTRFGVPSFGMLFNRPDLVPGIHADILAAVGA